MQCNSKFISVRFIVSHLDILIFTIFLYTFLNIFLIYYIHFRNIFEDELKKLQTGKEYISNIFQRLQIEGTQFRCKMALTYCKSKTQFHQPIINHQNFYNFH